MEQRDVLRHHGDRVAQAFLRHPRDVLAVDGDAALLDVVEALQQHEQRGLAAAGLADQSDPLAGLQAQAEAFEHLQPARILERDVVEGDRRAGPDQRLGFGVIAQFMRLQQRRDRFRHPRDMLGDVDQRDGEIARRIQDGKAERADQHDVAGGGAALLPELDAPRRAARRSARPSRPRE